MIIGLSGKKQSGKDTTGNIINILANSPHLNNEGVLAFLRKGIISKHNWQIKKFADKLKDIVCLLIGCTRDQLEDETFKNTPLGEEWDKWEVIVLFEKRYFNTLEEAKEFIKSKNINIYLFKNQEPKLIKMTPRLMLQLLGTECGTQIIHPQIWINSTFKNYKFEGCKNTGDACDTPNGDCTSELCYPNWIITDMRFPNELEAVKKRGFSIRIERDIERDKDEHISETALDNAEFDYIINNDGSIDELIDKVREILIKENIING